jgi:hypothetical protein
MAAPKIQIGCHPEAVVQEKGNAMLARVLTDAIKQIERYQAEMPEIYGGFTKEIDKVKADMKALEERIPKYRKGPV